jgi:hypothetical protein
MNQIYNINPAGYSEVVTVLTLTVTTLVLSSLDTPFTAPETCRRTIGHPDFSSPSQLSTLSTGGVVVYNYDIFTSTSLAIYKSECWPPDFGDIWNGSVANNVAMAYPGGACPVGFTSACRSTFGINTQVLCCPM